MRSSDNLEQKELLQKLIDSGYREFVEIFLNHDNRIYTKKGRLNKSAACRILRCKTKQLESALSECRKILDYH